MALKIAITKETRANEKRVAASPETVKKLTAMGCTVTIEKNAGALSHFSDSDYKEAGATIANDYSSTVKNADIVLCCLLYTSPSPRDQRGSRMPSSA